MAVSPGGVFARGSAGGVKKTRLGEQDKRAFGMFALTDVALGLNNFGEAAADVNCAGSSAGFRFPGNRRAQGVIHLEHAGSVAVLAQPSLI